MPLVEESSRAPGSPRKRDHRAASLELVLQPCVVLHIFAPRLRHVRLPCTPALEGALKKPQLTHESGSLVSSSAMRDRDLAWRSARRLIRRGWGSCTSFPRPPRTDARPSIRRRTRRLCRANVARRPVTPLVRSCLNSVHAISPHHLPWAGVTTYPQGSDRRITAAPRSERNVQPADACCRTAWRARPDRRRLTRVGVSTKMIIAT